jgi:hypothetical protein
MEEEPGSCSRCIHYQSSALAAAIRGKGDDEKKKQEKTTKRDETKRFFPSQDRQPLSLVARPRPISTGRWGLGTLSSCSDICCFLNQLLLVFYLAVILFCWLLGLFLGEINK